MSDAQQFEAFVRAYQNMVYATALRLTGRASDAEDIAQDVFLKAYERFAELRDNPSAGGWLKTVARNRSLNHLSRYRARWRFFSELAPDPEDDSPGPEWPAPEVHAEAVDATDRRRILEEALQRLPVSQRVPLVLFHFEELGYEEIAQRMRISLSKVKTDIHRGRAALAKKLDLGGTAQELRGLMGNESACWT